MPHGSATAGRLSKERWRTCLEPHGQPRALADACLVRMTELHRYCRVFKRDSQDFQVHRRFERQVIPQVAPD